MKIVELFEARDKDLTYREERFRSGRLKGQIQKVILALEGNNSGAMTRLANRYHRLDRSAKLLKEKRDELNAQIKGIGDRVFDAEDALVTRVIETITCTVMLTAGEKAETKQPTQKVDYESAWKELLKMVPELTEQMDELRERLVAEAAKIEKKHTETIPPKDTPTALKVTRAASLEEGIMSTLASWYKGFTTWLKSYDKRLAKLKAMV
jgi:predicted  nucleic acid-binding Zn-ribbon protein